MVEDWVVDPTLTVEDVNEDELKDEANKLGLRLTIERGNTIVLLCSLNKYLNYIIIFNLNMLFVFYRK